MSNLRDSFFVRISDVSFCFMAYIFFNLMAIMMLIDLRVFLWTDQIIWIIPPSQTRPHIIQKKIHTLKIVQILKTEINLVGPVEIKVQLGVWRKYCLGAGILEIGVLRRHRVNQMVQAFCLVFLVKCWKNCQSDVKRELNGIDFRMEKISRNLYSSLLNLAHRN